MKPFPFSCPRFTFAFHIPMLRNIRGVIGDLGDTIIAGRPMVQALGTSIRNVTGVQACEKTLYKGFGKPKLVHIREVLAPYYPHVSENTVKWINIHFENILMEHYQKHGIQYLKDTEEGIKELNRRHIRFGCTTGLSQDLIGRMYPLFPLWRPCPVKHSVRPSPAGIDEILKVWNYGVPPSQHINVAQCVKVGDSIADFDEAQAVGVPFVGIVGHRPDGDTVGAQMYREGAHAIVGSLDEFVKLLEKK